MKFGSALMHAADASSIALKLPSFSWHAAQLLNAVCMDGSISVASLYFAMASANFPALNRVFPSFFFASAAAFGMLSNGGARGLGFERLRRTSVLVVAAGDQRRRVQAPVGPHSKYM